MLRDVLVAIFGATFFENLIRRRTGLPRGELSWETGMSWGHGDIGRPPPLLPFVGVVTGVARTTCLGLAGWWLDAAVRFVGGQPGWVRVCAVSIRLVAGGSDAAEFISSTQCLSAALELIPRGSVMLSPHGRVVSTCTQTSEISRISECVWKRAVARAAHESSQSSKRVRV